MPMSEMQSQLAASAASRIRYQPLAVSTDHTDFAKDYMTARVTPGAQMAVDQQDLMSNVALAYGGSYNTERKPFVFAGGVAVIPIHGSLLNRYGYSSSYATGYNFIRSQINAAIADEDVEGIAFDVDSPGGEVAGCFELADDIVAASQAKPTVAIVDALCCSAAYALSCAAGRIVATPSAIVGSIGVLTMHIDVSEMLENFGVKITLLHAGEDKVAGNPFEKLPEATRTKIQERLELRYTEFVSLVAKNRSIGEDSVRATKARTFTSAEAVDNGLIDEVAAPIAAIASFHESLQGPQPENDQMTTGTDGTKAGTTPTGTQAAAAAPAGSDTSTQSAAAPAAAAPAADNGAATERQRINAILTSDEAKGHTALANHFAFETDMSADQAKAAMKAAGPGKAEEAESNPLETAMGATGGGAGVPADTSAQDTDPDRADDSAILGAMGRTPKTQ